MQPVYGILPSPSQSIFQMQNAPQRMQVPTAVPAPTMLLHAASYGMQTPKNQKYPSPKDRKRVQIIFFLHIRFLSLRESIPLRLETYKNHRSVKIITNLTAKVNSNNKKGMEAHPYKFLILLLIEYAVINKPIRIIKYKNSFSHILAVTKSR